MSKIVLFQPEIAGNVGSIIRTCACFDLELYIIEPCGFPFDIQRIKKSALDYFHHVKIFRYTSFKNFCAEKILPNKSRLVLASTKGDEDYRNFQFTESDYIIFGMESSGVSEEIQKASDHKIFIPMKNQMRSLNLAISCAIIAAASLK